jgi:hypothetical protein
MFRERTTTSLLCLLKRGESAQADFKLINSKLNVLQSGDKKWRILFFDIAELKKIHRDAFREKLRQIGFYPLQKSVWVCLFECADEIEILREFFGLGDNEVRLVESNSIGEDKAVKNPFPFILCSLNRNYYFVKNAIADLFYLRNTLGLSPEMKSIPNLLVSLYTG